MKGVANFLLGVVIVSFLLMSFSNVLMFFPWYLTIVYKTFNIATEASTVNYVQVSMVDDAKDDFATRAIFKDNIEDVHIKMDDTEITGPVDKESLRLQRGQKFTVTTKAKFPFSVKFFGNTFTKELDVSFSVPTTGIRYYKDMDPYSR